MQGPIADFRHTKASSEELQVFENQFAFWKAEKKNPCELDKILEEDSGEEEEMSIGTTSSFKRRHA